MTKNENLHNYLETGLNCKGTISLLGSLGILFCGGFHTSAKNKSTKSVKGPQL